MTRGSEEMKKRQTENEVWIRWISVITPGNSMCFVGTVQGGLSLLRRTVSGYKNPERSCNLPPLEADLYKEVALQVLHRSMALDTEHGMVVPMSK